MVAINHRYHLYQYLPDDMKAETDDLVKRIRALRDKFEGWAKTQDEQTQRNLGMIEVPGQKPRITDQAATHLFSKVLIPQTMPMPNWCEDGATEGYHVALGAIFNSGASCFFYGKDPDDPEGKTLVLLQQRKEQRVMPGETPASRYFIENRPYTKGALGGYTKKGEDSSVNAIREALEELPPFKGKPLFEIDERRMVLIYEGRDYESQRPPVQYSNYAYELAPEEIRNIKSALRDPTFAHSCREHSHGETTDILLKPIEEVLQEGRKPFKYSRQFDVLQEIGSRLRGKEPSSPIGFTIGDTLINLPPIKRLLHGAPASPKWNRE